LVEVKSRPFSIWLISSVLFVAAPFYILQYAFHFDVFSFNLSWMMILSLGFVVGFGVWKVQPWGYWGYLVFSSLVLVEKGYEYIHHEDQAYFFTTLILSVGFSALSFLLQKHMSSPYFNPRMKWWSRDPRYRVELDARFQVNNQKQKGNLLDISKGGCFAQLEIILFPGDVIDLKVDLAEHGLITQAKVIWRSSRPNGYGLMFYNLSSRQKKDVEKLIRYIERTHDTNLPPLEKHAAA
jgi:hypothetical protein